MEISYSDLVEIFFVKKHTEEEFIIAVKNTYNLLIENWSLEGIDNFDKKLSSFYVKAKSKWNAASRSKVKFLKNNDCWLSNLLCIDFERTDETDNLPSTSKNSRGRPRKSITECSSYTKNEDLFNMLAASSDPLISSLRHVRTEKDLKARYSPEMISLLEITSDYDESFQEI